MKNLNIRKKIMMLAMTNAFVLAGNSVTSYASDFDETVDITEFEDIRDIVVAKENEAAIMSSPDTSSNLVGILEPGDHLKLITDNENYYEVLYNGKICYVNKKYVDESTLDEISDINASDIVVAKELTNIIDSISVDSNIIGNLKAKESLSVNNEIDDYYQVNYKDGLAYVNKNDVDYVKKFKKSGYMNKDSIIYEKADCSNKIADIKELEFVKIYDETENSYYVSANNINGYINKDSVKLLNGKYIVVDISDQIVEVYDENKLLLSSSVVTGKPPKCSTPTGVQYIGDRPNEISDHRYLVGPGYKSYVVYMMKFVDNIGFHDSEYGIDDRGQNHGWRNYFEYGGTTYLTNGSHGCVNMSNEAACELYNIVKPYVVDQGNMVKVLVKE